jgi:hypothetical protein
MLANPEQAFGGANRLLGLIESIYAAVQQPDLWPSVLESTAEAIHGEALSFLPPFQANLSSQCHG